MAFSFSCPSCQAKHKAKEALIGRRVRCPKCGEALTVPSPEVVAAEVAQKSAAPAEPTAESAIDMPQDVPPNSSNDDEPIVLQDEKREDIDADMDMTPMVDVTFLLLIFFMVTAAFSLQKSIEIPKPKQDEASTNAQPQPPEEDPDFVTVWVDEFNTYRVVTLDWDVEAPSELELLRKLREAREGNSAGQIPSKLLVKAHGDSLHEKVVSALDAGTEVGIEQVQLMTVEEME